MQFSILPCKYISKNLRVVCQFRISQSLPHKIALQTMKNVSISTMEGIQFHWNCAGGKINFMAKSVNLLFSQCRVTISSCATISTFLLSAKFSLSFGICTNYCHWSDLSAINYSTAPCAFSMYVHLRVLSVTDCHLRTFTKPNGVQMVRLPDAPWSKGPPHSIDE